MRKLIIEFIEAEKIMNLAAKHIERISYEYAQILLDQAAENEPQITADLQKIAAETSAEMVGLENKFKSETSLLKKIIYQAMINFQYRLNREITREKTIEKTVSNLIKQQNDVLRYTFVLSFEKYVFGFKQTLEKLKRRNYVIPENKIWNAWKNIGTEFDKGYRGINVTVISSRGQKFELQFHTRESFQLKMKTHEIYKEAKMKETSRKRKTEIAETAIDLAKDVTVPEGAEKL